jgi:alkanesulfonate monooxygenase SsuD/methylene tetrahydromethanopterin reductase-like flavin-dependent oxidoreductase (luciferase family)
LELDLLIVSQEGVTWDDWCALADACERSAVPRLLAGDHYISTHDELGRVAHDAWTVIAGLAARTSALRLGTMVTPVTVRLAGLVCLGRSPAWLSPCRV